MTPYTNTNTLHISTLINDVIISLNQYIYLSIGITPAESSTTVLSSLPTLDESFYTPLTVARVKNILEIVESLQTTLETLKESAKDLTVDQMREHVHQFVRLMRNGMLENTRLNAQFGRQHQSYRQNRALGRGYFFSWWNKTFFQSRAQLTLENALEKIETFEARFLGISKKSTHKL